MACARVYNIWNGSSSAHAYYVTKWRTTYTQYKSSDTKVHAEKIAYRGPARMRARKWSGFMCKTLVLTEKGFIHIYNKALKCKTLCACRLSNNEKEHACVCEEQLVRIKWNLLVPVRLLYQGLIDRRRRERACNYIYV